MLTNFLLHLAPYEQPNMSGHVASSMNPSKMLLLEPLMWEVRALREGSRKALKNLQHENAQQATETKELAPHDQHYFHGASNSGTSTEIRD